MFGSSAFVRPKRFRFGFFVLALALVVGFIIDQSDIASSQSRKRSEKEQLLANGTVTVKLGNQFGVTPTDTVTIKKQLFTGSTTCASGGGNITEVTGVNPGAGHVISLSAADSVMIQPSTSTDSNGFVQGIQIPDGNPATFLPDNKVCIQGFNDANHNAIVSSTAGVQTFAFDTGSNTCTTTPKFLFNAGEKVCVRVVGSNGNAGQPWKLNVYGGRNNQCSSFFATVQLTGETLNQTYTLPLNNAAIPGACAGNPTTQISGDWQVRLDDFQNNFRGGINFRLRDPANINANVRVDKFIDSGLAGGTLPSGGGIIRWNLSVQNDGPDPAANVQLLDSMPAGINFVSMTQTAGPTFNCAAPVGQNITCTGLTSLQQGQFASFLLTATYPASPGGTTFTNNSSVFTSTNDLFITNNTSSAGGTLTPTNTPNQCQLTKNDLTVASTSAAGATVNYSAPTSTGATCTGTIQCSPASGSVFPIGVNPVGCVITNGNGAGGGQFNVIVTDAQRPDLTITKTSYAPYYLGQSGLYSLDVKNIGALSTNGTTVTVTEQPPQGVNVTNMSGTGWTCNVGTYSCTRNTVLAANASYPKIWVTVSFPTYQSSGPNITNTATVSGGGDGTAVNNTATNLSQVLPLGTGNAVTASGVTVSGRVMSGDGRGLTNARVMIAAPDGETRLVTTGRLGVFNFDDLETGQTYVISVASRRYSFSPQIVPVNDNVSGLIFIPNN